MGGALRLEITDRLGPAVVGAIAALVERVTDAEGVSPLSEHVALHVLQANGTNQLHICVWCDEELLGYGHLELPVEGGSVRGELAVEPASWSAVGAGDLVLETMLRQASGNLEIWCHGAHSAAHEALEARGFVSKRQLHQMRRSLTVPMPITPLPAAIEVRAFDPVHDVPAWLALNQRAFAGIPDQGSWTRTDLEMRIAQDWFDPAGFLLAHTVGADGSEGPLVGFHWTKIHGNAEHGHAPVGEVYVLGVDPDLQARGLGRALTVLGMNYLAARGLEEVVLYVDADNAAAIHTYERLGFSRFDTDVLYTRLGTLLP